MDPAKRTASGEGGRTESGQGGGTASGQVKKRRLERQPTLNAASAETRADQLAQKIIHQDLFLDGSLLHKMAEEHRDEFSRQITWTSHHHSGGHRTWASVCSGSEGAHFVMSAIEASNPQFKFQQVFACDSKLGVREWIDSVVNGKRTASGQDKICIFKNITDLAGATAECHAHGRQCRVPDANIVIGCSSCKDLSNLQGKSTSTPVLGKEESPGGTALTWKGLLGYLDNHLVDIVLYENSDNLEDGGSDLGRNEVVGAAQEVSNLEMFKAQFSSRGFEGQNMVLDSWKFGTSARRRRFWSMQVRTHGTLGCIQFAGKRTVTDIFKTFRGLVALCQRRPCGAERLLLPDDNPHVERELLRRTASGKGVGPAGWVEKHRKAYNHIRLSWGLPTPHDKTTSSPWFRTLTGCQKSSLTYQHHKLLASVPRLENPFRSNQCHTLMLDVDQSVDRAFKSTTLDDGKTAIAPCMMPGQKMWVHTRDGQERLLLGREALVLQASPVALVEEQLAKVSDAFQNELAGNAMSFLVLLAVAQSGFASLTWREQSSDEDLGAASSLDVDEAMGLLGMMSRY